MKRSLSYLIFIVGLFIIIQSCKKNEPDKMYISNLKNGGKFLKKQNATKGTISSRGKISYTNSSGNTCSGAITFDGEFTVSGPSSNIDTYISKFYTLLDQMLRQRYAGNFDLTIGGYIRYSNATSDIGLIAESLIRDAFQRASQETGLVAGLLYLTVRSSGGCSLETDPIDGGGPPIPDIIDALTDPCFKKTLAKGTNSNFTNTVDSIIKKLNSNSKVKVIVAQKDHVYDSQGNEVDGITTAYNYNNNEFSCTIQLNASVMNGATQEYTLSTIIHEILHAYIRYDGGQHISLNQSHNDIVNKYVKPFADLLNLIYPNLTMRDATALAWGGLKGTDLWKSSFESDTFSIGTTSETMTFAELQGLMNAHHSGYAVNGSDKCAD